MIQQLNYYSGIADEQTAQLLKKEQRKYEEDQKKVDRVLSSVDTALASGVATAEDMRTLTNPKATDEQRLAVAQSVISRRAQQDVSMDRQMQQAQLANIYDQIRARAESAKEEMANATTEAEKKEAERKTKTEQALGMYQILKDLGNMGGMSSAVGVGLKKTFLDAIPFVSGDAVEGSARADFETQATRLSDMFLVDNLGKMTGVLTDKDLEVLRSEGTTIGNFNQSEESWNKELARLQAMVERGIRENGITAEQAVFYGMIDENDAQSLDAIWDNL
jgi:hypothetical protein